MTWLTRAECGSCGSSDLELILDLGTSPIANEFPTEPNNISPAALYPLRMVQCAACKLAQIGDVVPDELLWRGEYGYYSSTSVALVKHMKAYATDLGPTRRQLVSKHDLVIEVGCNDGLLMRHLHQVEPDARIVGVDPAKGPAAVATGLGLDVRVAEFSRDFADQLIGEVGRADVVIANNVAAHVSDLDDFLSGLTALLSPRGTLVMEVQYLPDLLVGNGFDMLYHEHRFFYSLTSLSAALLRRGLVLVDVEFVETQGGSIRVFARRVDTDASSTAWSHGLKRVADALWSESRLSDGGILTGLQFRADRIASRLRAEVRSLMQAGAVIAAYGAPAKATTLLHWTKVAPYLSWAEDTTPAKVGRFMPGTSIHIREDSFLRDGRPDAYLLTAWNYAPYILAKERNYIANGGRFVLPLPSPITL